jgi:nitrite reductase/ring-hydroxylating ferredoxin subunit
VVIGPLAEFPAGGRQLVTVDRREIGVFRFEDSFYAVRNRCPHQGGPLCLGKVKRPLFAGQPGRLAHADEPPMLACPWHGWEYDLVTGQSFAGPGERHVRAYEVAVERVPGPYVAETFAVQVEEEVVVLYA